MQESILHKAWHSTEVKEVYHCLQHNRCKPISHELRPTWSNSLRLLHPVHESHTSPWSYALPYYRSILSMRVLGRVVTPILDQVHVPYISTAKNVQIMLQFTENDYQTSEHHGIKNINSTMRNPPAQKNCPLAMHALMCRSWIVKWNRLQSKEGQHTLYRYKSRGHTAKCVRM